MLKPWQILPELGPPFLLSLLLHTVVFGSCLFFLQAAKDSRLSGGGDQGGILVLLAGDGFGSMPTHTTKPRLQPARVMPQNAPAPESTTERTSATSGAESPMAEGTFGGSGTSGGFGAGGDVNDPRLRRIREQIEAAKIYPNFALNAGIQGTVRVRFKIDAAGNPEEARVVTSSGSPILDEATLSTIKRAAPYPNVAGWITFPLHYNLASN